MKIYTIPTWLLAAHVASAGLCDKKVHVQFVQVQDATESFSDDSKYLPKLFEELKQVLEQDGHSGEYGMSLFRDKAQAGVGFGNTTGIWSIDDTSRAEMEEDYCYRNILPLTKNVKDTFLQDVNFAGGKDDMENQYDALYRSVIDPSIGWSDKKHDEDGKIILKFAMLVTDAPAHRNSAEDSNEERRNWHYEETMKGPCAYKDAKCTDKHGWASSKTGTIRSLKGVLDHYNHFRFGNDSERYSSMEFGGSKYQTQLEQFRYCCTDVYSGFPNLTTQSSPHYYFLSEGKCGSFSTYEGCAAASCLFCKNGACDDTPECLKDPKWEAAWMTATRVDVDISDYAYGDFDKLGEDCATMEYPDPFSEEYYKVFNTGLHKDNNVIPLILARTAGQNAALPVAGSRVRPDVSFLSAHVCPELEYNIMKYQNCLNNTAFNGVLASHGIGRADGISRHKGCEGFDASDSALNELYGKDFYKNCMDVEYGKPVKLWKHNGVNGANLTIVDSDSQQDKLIAAMKQIILKAVAADPDCKSTTPAPAPIPVVTTPTTTKATTTATIKAPTTTTTKAPTTATTKAPTTTITTSTTTTQECSNDHCLDPRPHCCAMFDKDMKCSDGWDVAKTGHHCSGLAHQYTCCRTKPTVAPATTSVAPTTATVAPTTTNVAPTSPITKAPTTEASTTKAPKTEASTTKAPATKAPTTEASTTKASTTKAPATKATTTKAPKTEASTTKAPATKAPATKAPATKAPATKAPATKASTDTHSKESSTGLPFTMPAPPTRKPQPPAPEPTAPEETTAQEETSTKAGGSKTVVIGSAAGGAAAVAGGIASLMAKGVIPGMSPSAPSSAHVDTVDSHNDIAEREQLTEIDAEMFV